MDLNDHLHRLETTGSNVENVGNVSSEQRHKQINNMLFNVSARRKNIFSLRKMRKTCLTTLCFFSTEPLLCGYEDSYSIAEKNRICILYFLRRVLRILRGWGRPNVNSDIFTSVPIVDL